MNSPFSLFARTIHAGILLLLLALGSHPAAAATSPTAPAPPVPAAGSGWHVDLERWFFASPAAVRGAIVDLGATLDRLDRLHGKATRTPEALERALTISDSALTATRRLGDYFHLRASLDATDLASARAEDSLWTALSARNGWLDEELAHLDFGTFARYARTRPALTSYRFALAEARRAGAHALKPSEERVLRETATLATAWPYPLTQLLGPGTRDARAYVLLTTARTRNTLASLRHFASAPEEAYYSRHLTVPEVKGLIAQVRAQGSRYQEFLRLKAANARREGTASAPFDSARVWMSAALAPLGQEYGHELASILDPAASRLDLGPGAHRRPGGFSFVSPNVTTGVYLESYAGSLRDLRRLTHETGHALHRRLMDHHNVPVRYRDGPLLMEPVALFNELVVVDHVARTAADTTLRRQALELSLNNAFEVFRGAQDAELEQAIYDGVAAGTLETADDLDRLTHDVDAAYVIDPDSSATRRWMRVGLLVEDPLYLSNYLYSGMIALALYARFEERPQEFASKYLAFLSGGFPVPAADLLRKDFGIDLGDKGLLGEGMRFLDRRLAEYSALSR